MTDPDNHDQFRRQAHALVDWMADYLDGIEDRSPWADVEPGWVRAQLPSAAPDQPDSFEAVMSDVDRVVVPGTAQWQHPNWFAYFPCNSSDEAIFAEMVAATLGSQSMLWRSGPAATEVESLVLDQLATAVGLPDTFRVDSGVGGGVIQPSASDSTHTALVAARHRATRGEVSIRDLVAYTSAQAHSSVEKGARVAGFEHVRLVPASPWTRTMDVDALRQAIASDRSAGLVPAFVCSTVGTTGTGAVDPVTDIAEVAAAEGLWHHVDAAWAGSYMLCPEFRDVQAGVASADSYVTNPHKLLGTGMDLSAFFVADRTSLFDALSITPAYLRTAASADDRVVDYRDWSVSLGRRFRALKLWFVFRLQGLDAIRNRLREHVSMAEWLAAQVDASDRLALYAPRSFGLVCIAHAEGDDATRSFISRVESDTSIAVTASEEDGRAYLRISIGAPTTGLANVERLWQILEDAAG